MIWFLQSIDLDLWHVIEDDLTFPSKLVDGVMVPKPKQEWDERGKRNFQLNVKVVYTCNALWIEMNIIEYVNANQLKKFGDYLK